MSYYPEPDKHSRNKKKTNKQTKKSYKKQKKYQKTIELDLCYYAK